MAVNLTLSHYGNSVDKTGTKYRLNGYVNNYDKTIDIAKKYNK